METKIWFTRRIIFTRRVLTLTGTWEKGDTQSYTPLPEDDNDGFVAGSWEVKSKEEIENFSSTGAPCPSPSEDDEDDDDNDDNDEDDDGNGGDGGDSDEQAGGTPTPTPTPPPSPSPGLPATDASTITINGEEMVDTAPGDTVYVSLVMPSDKGYSVIHWYLAGPDDSGYGSEIGSPTYSSGNDIETETTQMFSMPLDASGVYTFTAYIYPHSSASDQTVYEYSIQIYCD